MPISDTTVFTTINRKWLMKMGVAAVVALVLFVWGYIDATSVYPEQGIKDASYKQKEYLRMAKLSPGRLAATSIAEPQARFEKLKATEAEFEKVKGAAAAAEAKGNAPGAEAERITLLPKVIEAAEFDWLAALNLVGRLDPQYTTMANPAKTFDDLDALWKKSDPPKALAAYDIPLQWGITGAGLLWFVYLAVLFIKVKRTRYGWDDADKRLHLPDGSEITPGDVVELDKRRWDKFYVTLVTKSGKNPELDLYRYDPLEDWVLELEGPGEDGDEGTGKKDDGKAKPSESAESAAAGA